MGGVAHRAETRVYRRRPPRELCRREAARGFHRGTPARGSGLGVKLGALLGELAGLFFQALAQRLFLAKAVLGGVFADIFRDLHRAKLRAAHRAEVRRLGRFLRQGRVVESGDGFAIKRQTVTVPLAWLRARCLRVLATASRDGAALEGGKGVPHRRSDHVVRRSAGETQPQESRATPR
jgi:hypothetical protein